MISIDSIFSLTSVGLAYDGVGVAILGYTFFTTSIKSIFLGSRSYYGTGGNKSKLESGTTLKVDGICGTSLLVIGFILQWLGANNFSHAIVSQVLYVVLGLFLLLYFISIRRLAIEHYLSEVKGEESK